MLLTVCFYDLLLTYVLFYDLLLLTFCFTLFFGIFFPAAHKQYIVCGSSSNSSSKKKQMLQLRKKRGLDEEGEGEGWETAVSAAFFLMWRF